MATSVWSAGTRKGLMFRGILVLSLALVVSAATSAMAREVRAPFDTGGCVQTMTRAMAEEFHLGLRIG